MLRLCLFSSSVSLIPGAALAHAGHLADLAGHSHWAGLAALAGAAAVAAVAAKLRGRKSEDEAGQDDTDATAEPEAAQ